MKGKGNCEVDGKYAKTDLQMDRTEAVDAKIKMECMG